MNAMVGSRSACLSLKFEFDMIMQHARTTGGMNTAASCRLPPPANQKITTDEDAVGLQSPIW